MRIGIYNHWLSTLGGGEKVTAAMAEALSHHYQVDLIGPERVPRSQIEDRINVDLGKVDVKVINIMERTPSFTKEYDLFINATHGAILPTMCKRNILYVYFPIRLVGGSLLKRTLKAFLFRRFRYGHPLEGSILQTGLRERSYGGQDRTPISGCRCRSPLIRLPLS